MHVPGAKLVPHVHHAKQHQSGEKHHCKTSRQDIPCRLNWRNRSKSMTTKYMEAHLNPTHLSGYIPLLFPEVVETAPPVDRTLASVEAHF